MNPLTVLSICIILILAIRNYPDISYQIRRRRDHKEYMAYRSQFLSEQQKKEQKAKEEYDRQRKDMVKF